MDAGLLLGLILGPLLLLALPVELSFEFEGVERFDGRVRIVGLFGLVRIRVPMSGRAPARPPDATSASGPARAASDRRGRRFAATDALLRAPARRRVLRLLGRLVRAVRIRRLHLHARVGLGDPADTGRLWALLGPVSGWARTLRGARIRIDPEFIEPVLEIQARGRVRIVPLQIIVLVGGFMLWFAAWQACAGRGRCDG